MPIYRVVEHQHKEWLVLAESEDEARQQWPAFHPLRVHEQPDWPVEQIDIELWDGLDEDEVAEYDAYLDRWDRLFGADESGDYRHDYRTHRLFLLDPVAFGKLWQQWRQLSEAEQDDESSDVDLKVTLLL